ncbi:beta-N-acetylhexosaminidase [Paenibacillus tarimensis]
MAKQKNVLRDMTLQEKIGQLFMCGFEGYEPSESIRMLIRRYRIGGIIYFRRNVNHVRQVTELSQRLQQINDETGASLPLLISIDQEGGMVARIDGDDVAVMPGNMALGATANVEAAYETAYVSGRELYSMGINMNFAPCLDVNNNPLNPVIGVRSYGEDPRLAAGMGAAAIRGYADAGIAATAKHFPGHGDTASDSHLDLPVIPHSMERLERIELVPFRKAIEAGVDAIMTAHVVFPAMDDDDVPSTLSGRIIKGLLRTKLGYDGVVVTDCLEMNAISEGVGIAEGAVRAIGAGADLVLVSHRMDRQIEAIEAVIQAVKDGRISEEQIDMSVDRIIRLKQRRLGNKPPIVSAADFLRIGSEEHRAVGRKWSEKSVTLVKQGEELPLDMKEATLVVWPEVRKGTEVDEVIPQQITLGAALSSYIADVEEVRIGIEPSPDEAVQVLHECRKRKQVVFATYNASFSSGQVKLVRQLLQQTGVRLVVIALRNPFDITSFPEVPTYVACYENRPLMMESAAKVLVGLIPAVGKLPVTLQSRRS